MPNQSPQAGFTLIELMVAVAVIAILATMAVPAYQNMVENRRLSAAAEGIYAQLQFARSESIKLNKDLYVSVQANTPWCLGITDNAAGCNCNTGGACQYVAGASTMERVLKGTDFQNVGISTTRTTLHIDAVRGSFDGSFGSITVGSSKAKIMFSQMGRIRLCTDSGFGGYPSC